MNPTAIAIKRLPGHVEVTLTRPEKLNPLGVNEWQSIVDAITTAEQDETCRAIVLRSTGRFFCAGNDLNAMLMLETREEHIEYFTSTLLRGFIHMLTSPLPIICAIHADTAGGGIELALYSDYVIAQDNVNFSLPENFRGLFAATLVSATPSGYSRAALQKLAFTGEPVNAETAANLGLVHQVVPGHKFEVAIGSALAAISASAPDSIAATKQQLNARLIDEGIPAVAGAITVLAEQIVAGNGRHGLESFKSKQQPSWAPRSREYDLDRRAQLIAEKVENHNATL